MRGLNIDKLFGYSPQLTKEDIKNFVNAVVENPGFEPLKKDERYNLLVKKLKEKLGENSECNKYRKSK
ncbi:DNA-binding protein [Clostridium sp. L74]|nr:DNA-binding protein [Clostridium sp. L74]